jgi:uncharacterized RDD family membrane protein YckC
MSDEYFTPPPAVEPSSAQGAPVWELSGWWRRVGASVIDGIVIWLPIGIVFTILEETAGFPQVISYVCQFLVASAYYMYLMPAWNGQTVGKRATSIRVVREDGQPIDAKFAFVRQILVIGILFDTIGLLFLLIPTILNYLWPLWDDNHQALHDKIVKSRVVRADPVSDPGTLQAASQHTPPPPVPAPIPNAPDAPVFPTAPPPPAPPSPPTPGGTSTPYTPPPGFDNPVPDDD